MSLAPCSLPGSLPSFVLGSDEMELGLGKSLTPLLQSSSPFLHLLQHIAGQEVIRSRYL